MEGREEKGGNEGCVREVGERGRGREKGCGEGN